jgi:hypothetical protein
MHKFRILKEFLTFLRVEKKWWIAPIILALLLVGLLIIFGKGSILSPFIYTLF